MKYNLLIVDDEYYICEGLRTMLKSFSLPQIGEIRVCYSGEEALDLCRTYKPQIVLTDIKMTGINGIELIRELNMLLYPVRFLVLSGYDDYEYVRDAFQNGAVDYLLKPVISTQLEELIQKQCQFLEADTPPHKGLRSREETIALSRRLLSSVMQPEYAFNAPVMEEELRSFLPYDGCTFCLIAAVKEDKERLHRTLNMIYDHLADSKVDSFLCSDLPGNKIALLLSHPQKSLNLTSLWDMILRQTGNGQNPQFAVAISRTAELPSLYSLYYEAENRLSQRLTDGYGRIFQTDLPSPGRRYPGKLKQLTSSLFQSPDLLYAGNLWEQIRILLHRLNISELKHFYNYFMGLLRSHLAEYGVSEDTGHFSVFYDFSSREELETYLHRQLQQYAAHYPAAQKKRSNIEQIKAYIDDHFTSAITLKEVADIHFISASHLSKLFHETYHMSFQDYLSMKRMTYAEKLLRDPLLSVQEIAAMTGYDNAFNFSRAFKNYFGISPSHYRKQNI